MKATLFISVCVCVYALLELMHVCWDSFNGGNLYLRERGGMEGTRENQGEQGGTVDPLVLKGVSGAKWVPIEVKWCSGMLDDATPCGRPSFRVGLGRYPWSLTGTHGGRNGPLYYSRNPTQAQKERKSR